jgi:hypothetical protein
MRHHNCEKNHRKYSSLAECIYGGASARGGDGPFALLAHCGSYFPPTHKSPFVNTSITLWMEVEKALEEARALLARKCGGQCTGDHEVVELDLVEGTATTVPLLETLPSDWD